MNKTIIAIITLLAFAFISFGKDTLKENTPHVNQMYATGGNNNANNPAPNFILTSSKGKKIKLSDYKGKVVIVDFWATWCPPCRRGIPDLIEIQKEFGKHVVVIGISMDTDTKRDVVPFIQQMGINYPVAYATPEVVQSYGGVESIPSSFVIDKKGNIIESYIGLVSKSDFTSVIKKLLNKS